eukprot:3634974-Amphidinium_carterae.1
MLALHKVSTTQLLRNALGMCLSLTHMHTMQRRDKTDATSQARMQARAKTLQISQALIQPNPTPNTPPMMSKNVGLVILNHNVQWSMIPLVMRKLLEACPQCSWTRGI